MRPRCSVSAGACDESAGGFAGAGVSDGGVRWRGRLSFSSGAGPAGGATEEPPGPARLSDASTPYGQLVELARRRAFYAALTTEVFDEMVARSCDPRFRKRPR